MPESGMPVPSNSSSSRRGVVIVQSMYRAYQMDRVYGLIASLVCQQGQLLGTCSEGRTTRVEIAFVADKLDKDRSGTEVGSHREIGDGGREEDSDANPMESSLTGCEGTLSAHGCTCGRSGIPGLK